MAEPQPEEPIDITARPYLQSLGEPRHPRRAATGSAHLLAAATGTPVEPVPLQAVPTFVAGVPGSISAATSTTRAAVHASATAQDPITIHTASAGVEPVDYDLVTKHVRELDVQGETTDRAREVFDIASASQSPETPEEQAAWRQIEQLVDRHVTQVVLQQGDNHDWPPAQRAAHIQAVFDDAFRYGPLSPLLREDVEDIDIRGFDEATVTFPDGHIEKRPPVTSSDEQLEEYIAKIATDRGRQFARPHGHVKLDLGGARFTGVGGPQKLPRPRIAIRKHRLVDIDLFSLMTEGTLTRQMAEFLTATARAYTSHLISGSPKAGKTTFMRALASAIPPEVPIVTIETERELYLDKLKDRHRHVDPLQYLPDLNGGDDRTATFSLNAALEIALRLNAQVILFGEIGGPSEAPAAIKALQAGKGASATIHAESAYDAIQRLATMLMEAGGLSDDSGPQRQILHAVDFIVQLELIPAGPHGPQRRVVSEIAEIIPGDGSGGRDQRPIVKMIYRWNEDGHFFEFVEEPSVKLQRRLFRAGLRPTFFDEHQA